MLTRAPLVTDRQRVRPWKAFFALDAHTAVEVTYRVYERLITIYEAKSTRAGKTAM